MKYCVAKEQGETSTLLKIIRGKFDCIFSLCTHLNYPSSRWTPSEVYLISTFPCPHSDVQRLETDRAKRPFV